MPENKFASTIVFDFDGVIHSCTSGWKGEDCTPDPPVPGIAEMIDKLRNKGYQVVVVSTRCCKTEGITAVQNYLSRNGIIVDGIMAEKPPAICYEVIMNIPKGEISWVRCDNACGNERYFITSNKTRDQYFLYEVKNGDLVRIAKARSPASFDRLMRL